MTLKNPSKSASQGPHYFPFLFQSVTKPDRTYCQPGIGSGLLLLEPRTAVLLLSSPSNHEKRLNHQKTKEKKLSRKWHTRFPPQRIIKAVGYKQTRPISRVFAFNASPQTIANQRIIGNPNRMKTLQIQPAEAQFSPITRMF
jgi:hypothetical protein